MTRDEIVHAEGRENDGWVYGGFENEKRRAAASRRNLCGHAVARQMLPRATRAYVEAATEFGSTSTIIPVGANLFLSITGNNRTGVDGMRLCADGTKMLSFTTVTQTARVMIPIDTDV